MASNDERLCSMPHGPTKISLVNQHRALGCDNLFRTCKDQDAEPRSLGPDADNRIRVFPGMSLAMNDPRGRDLDLVVIFLELFKLMGLAKLSWTIVLKRLD